MRLGLNSPHVLTGFPGKQTRKWIWKGCKPNSVCPDPEGSGEKIICLSSQYPEPVPLSRTLERAAPRSPIWPCTRWGFPCPPAHAGSGGLLPRLFTLTQLFLNPPGRLRAAQDSERAGRFIFCGTVRWLGLSAGPPACIPGKTRVTRHRALRCSDFPPPRLTPEKRPSALPNPTIRYPKTSRSQGSEVFRLEGQFPPP